MCLLVCGSSKCCPESPLCRSYCDLCVTLVALFVITMGENEELKNETPGGVDVMICCKHMLGVLMVSVVSWLVFRAYCVYQEQYLPVVGNGSYVEAQYG